MRFKDNRTGEEVDCEMMMTEWEEERAAIQQYLWLTQYGFEMLWWEQKLLQGSLDVPEDEMEQDEEAQRLYDWRSN